MGWRYQGKQQAGGMGNSPAHLNWLADPLVYGGVVQGDSITPEFGGGNIAFASPKGKHEPGMFAIYRLDDGDCGIKVIEPTGQNELRLIPLNPAYPIRQVARDRVVRLARVVMAHKAMAPPEELYAGL